MCKIWTYKKIKNVTNMSKKIEQKKFPWSLVFIILGIILFAWLYIGHIIERDKHSIYYNPGQDAVPNLPPAQKGVMDYVF